MKNLKIKFKEIYLPFLCIAVVTIVFYTTFRWFLATKLGLSLLKEELLNFWIPFILPWFPILIGLRKRIRILAIKDSRGNGYFFYQLIMVVSIAIPLVIAQDYIQKATFNLISIENINEIEQHPNEKYFEISTFQIDKNNSLPYTTSRTSGRNNEQLTFYTYIASPFKNNKNIWYGITYSKNISNHIDNAQKSIEHKNFLTTITNKFHKYNFQNVTYFEKLGYSDKNDGFLEAIYQKELKVSTKKPIILIPKTVPFEQNHDNSLSWFFTAFLLGNLVVLVLIFIPKLDEKEISNFKENKPLQNDELKDFLHLLNPKGSNKGTAILLLINILVFIALLFYGLNIISPTPKELLEVGGIRKLEVLNGEYWRVFTSIFIHSGIMHLLMNFLALVLSGTLLENVLGSVKLIVSFIICGVLASFASIYWHDHTISVGASGAIFGLFGILLVFTIFKIYNTDMRKITWPLLAIYGGISIFFIFLGGIDNAAHFGGLLTGCILGGFFILFNKKQLLKNARTI